MPHVFVKMHPGRSEQQKAPLAEAITQQVMAIARVGDDAVSVAIEGVGPIRSIGQISLVMPTNCTKNLNTARLLRGTCLGKALWNVVKY